MSIFKDTFPDYVRKQLEVREKIIKQGNNPGEDRFATIEGDDITIDAGAFYTLTTSKQCVIRMSSGVDVVPGTFPDYPNEPTGPALARRFVLEAGVPGNKAGIGVGGAYGDRSSRGDAYDGYGITPMPGILDASIRTVSPYGSLRQAKVNFVCHNRSQLDVLEMLYMRPGYPILLEWGWAPYINNKGKREEYFPELSKFFDPNSTFNIIQDEVFKRKKDSSGNYDAFIGYCKNFNYEAREDGGYNCSTDIIALGEVLTGLKGTNTLGVDNKSKDTFIFYLQALLDANYLISRREQVAGYESKYEDDPRGDSKRIKEISDTVIEIIKIAKGKVPVLDNPVTDVVAHFTELLAILNPFLLTEATDTFGFSVTGNEDDATYLGFQDFKYIRWDLLCEILNSKVVEEYKIGDQPIMQFSYTEDDTGGELILDDEFNLTGIKRITPYTGNDYPIYLDYNTLGIQGTDSVATAKVTVTKKVDGANVESKTIDRKIQDILDNSFDPEICILPHSLDKSSFGQKSTIFDNSGLIGEDEGFMKARFKKTYGIKDNITDAIVNQFARSIGLIFLEMDYLISLYDDMKYDDKDRRNNDFNLYDFVEKIWNDVNVACADNHTFILHSKSTSYSNVVRVIDAEFDSKLVNDNTVDKMYTFKPLGNESIVRNFVYTSKIPSAVASTIAVSAQAPDSVGDLDSVSFAYFNQKAKSRFTKSEEKPTDSNKQNYSNNLVRKQIALDEACNRVQKYVDNILSGNYDGENDTITNGKLSKKSIIQDVQEIESGLIYLNTRYPEDKKDADGVIINYKGERKTPSDYTMPSKSAIIPLDFQLRMDGISGVVIGNLFKIDLNMLPKGYKDDKIHFIVTQESQKITAGQDWTTDLRGQIILLNKDADSKATILQDDTSQGSISDITVDELWDIYKETYMSPEQQYWTMVALAVSENGYLTRSEIDVLDNLGGILNLGKKDGITGPLYQKLASYADVAQSILNRFGVLPGQDYKEGLGIKGTNYSLGGSQYTRGNEYPQPDGTKCSLTSVMVFPPYTNNKARPQYPGTSAYEPHYGGGTFLFGPRSINNAWALYNGNAAPGEDEYVTHYAAHRATGYVLPKTKKWNQITDFGSAVDAVLAYDANKGNSFVKDFQIPTGNSSNEDVIKKSIAYATSVIQPYFLGSGTIYQGVAVEGKDFYWARNEDNPYFSFMEYTKKYRVRGRVSFRGLNFREASIRNNVAAGGSEEIGGALTSDGAIEGANPNLEGIQRRLRRVFHDGYNYFFFEGFTKKGELHANELNQVIEVDGDNKLRFFEGGVNFSDDDSLMEDNPQLKRVAKYAIKALDTVSNLLGPKKSI